MRAHGSTRNWQPQHSVLFGQTSCLCFGIGLIIWGLAPAVIERIVTGSTPPLHMLTVNSVVFGLGALFIGATVLIRRRVRWAAWIAFAIAVMLAGASAAFVFSGGSSHVVSSFLLLLSAETGFATWLAIGGLAWLHANEQAEQAAQAAELEEKAQRRARGNRMFTHL